MENLVQKVNAELKARGLEYKTLTEDDIVNYVVQTVKQRIYNRDNQKNLRKEVNRLRIELQKKGVKV